MIDSIIDKIWQILLYLQFFLNVTIYLIILNLIAKFATIPIKKLTPQIRLFQKPKYLIFELGSPTTNISALSLILPYQNNQSN